MNCKHNQHNQHNFFVDTTNQKTVVFTIPETQIFGNNISIISIISIISVVPNKFKHKIDINGVNLE